MKERGCNFSVSVCEKTGLFLRHVATLTRFLKVTHMRRVVGFCKCEKHSSFAIIIIAAGTQNFV